MTVGDGIARFDTFFGISASVDMPPFASIRERPAAYR
jgi:hypothetical protein